MLESAGGTRGTAPVTPQGLCGQGKKLEENKVEKKLKQLDHQAKQLEVDKVDVLNTIPAGRAKLEELRRRRVGENQ